MSSTPVIVIQIVHIQGALKGEIQDFTDSEITIGRHSKCHVRYPNDISTISRYHAKIVRDGNRFKVIDTSSNGTFLNGKEIKESYLKDGDVLVFSENGPKFSFLTKVTEKQEIIEQAQIPPEPPKEKAPSVIHENEVPQEKPAPVQEAPIAPVQTPDNKQSIPLDRPSVTEEIQVKAAKVPLVVLYGPTLRTYDQLPLTVGKSPECECNLLHASILDRHAEFFFHQNQYWVKDLTGRNLVTINNVPVQKQAQLNNNDCLAFSPSGPFLRFLDGGRLAEIENHTEELSSKSDNEPEILTPGFLTPEKPVASDQPPFLSEQDQEQEHDKPKLDIPNIDLNKVKEFGEKGIQGAKSIFKKFWDK